MKKELHEAFLEGASVYASYIDGIIQNGIIDSSERANYFVSLRKKGCDIQTIILALFSVSEKWYEKYGFTDLTVDLTTEVEREKAHNKEKAKIEKAMRVLSELPKVEIGLWWAVMPDTNEKLSNMQEAIREFQKTKNEYFEYLYPPHPKEQSDDDSFARIERSMAFRRNPRQINKTLSNSKTKGEATKILKLDKSAHGVWDYCKINIVDELKRIGYSERKAFITTGRIIKDFYPKIYTDDDPDLVRQTYTYHKKKK